MVAIAEWTCLEITAYIQKKLVELWRSEPLGKFMQERIKDLRERIVRSKTNWLMILITNKSI